MTMCHISQVFGTSVGIVNGLSAYFQTIYCVFIGIVLIFVHFSHIVLLLELVGL